LLLGIFDVQQRGAVGITIVGLRDPLAGAADNQYQSVAARPAALVNDLLDDRGKIGCALIAAGSTDGGPRWWYP
jgi:hypothetical protein